MHMELEACWNETEWLLRCHECIVNNIPEEYCSPTPLPIPPDYAHNLGRRSKMAIKSILPPSLKTVLNTYNSLPPQPSQPSPQRNATPQRRSVQQSPPPQQCSVTRVAAAEKTTVERSPEKACMEESTEGRMEPEPGELEPTSTGTGFEAPRQQRLSN